MNQTKNKKLASLLKSLALAAFISFATVGWGQTAMPGETQTLLLEVKRFVIEGENPLSERETEAILAPYLGPHKSIDTIEAAANALEQALRGRGFSFHRVIVPAQRPVAGELHLRILHFSLNEVTVTGNQNFTSENILRSLPALQPGNPPDVRALSRELGLANEHPSKHLTVNIKESMKADALDADVRVRDVPSSQAFVGFSGHTRDFDNTINRNTGYTRLTVGYQNSNLFYRDHVLTLAYTTSPEHVSRVTQLGVFYWLPLYGYDTALSGYWTKSNINIGSVGLGGQSFSVSGRGEFWGVRATYALPRVGELTHNASIAFDERFFESSIGLLGTPVGPPDVRSSPLSLRYTARTDILRGAVGGYAEYLRNVSAGGGASSDAAFAANRAGAKRDWEAVRWGLDASYALPKNWVLRGRLSGQYAHQALIPGEQFGIGGAASVRGVRERETAGDKGYFLSIEAQGPAIASALLPFVFYDQGYRKHVVPVPGIPDNDTASSIGAGLRWSWQRRLELSATYANVLNGLGGGTPRGHNQLLFSVFYRL